MTDDYRYFYSVLPELPALQFKSQANKVYLTIKTDGTVEIPEDVSMDEASRRFWEYAEQHGPARTIRELRRENSELQGELLHISAAISGADYLDPPDGGDVPLAEQVRRMRAEVLEARSELRANAEYMAELITERDAARENAKIEMERRLAALQPFADMVRDDYDTEDSLQLISVYVKHCVAAKKALEGK